MRILSSPPPPHPYQSNHLTRQGTPSSVPQNHDLRNLPPRRAPPRNPRLHRSVGHTLATILTRALRRREPAMVRRGGVEAVLVAVPRWAGIRAIRAHRVSERAGAYQAECAVWAGAGAGSVAYCAP
jgi:hypothetical protein